MKEEIPAIHLAKASVPVILYEFAIRSEAEKRAKELAKTAEKYGLFYTAKKDGDSYELFETEFATSRLIRCICRVPLQPMRTFVEAVIANRGICAASIMHPYEVLEIIYTVGFSIDSATYVAADEVD